jgi:myb proto-oncogene protein
LISNHFSESLNSAPFFLCCLHFVSCGVEHDQEFTMLTKRVGNSGCKFSADEERVVLELQAQFGNKWARIATYLPGRTDNDVKNFWSTRQKRLARLLRAPLPGPSSRSTRAKQALAASTSSLQSRPSAVVSTCNSHCSPILHFLQPTDVCSGKRSQGIAVICPQYEIAYFLHIHEYSLMEMCVVNCHRQGPSDRVPECSSSGVHPCSAATPFMNAQNAVPYDQAAGSRLVGFNGALLPLAPAIDSHSCSSSSNAAPLQTKLPFDEPPYPLLDYPGIPEGWSMAPGGFINAGAMDDLAYQELLPMVTQPAPMIFPFFGTGCAQGGVKAEPPDAPDFFDDLPPDMFDSFDQLPPPWSPPATSSGF